MINYFIGTINVAHFTINQTIGTLILRPGVTIRDLQVNQFPITFKVFAQDLGSPRQTSQANATVIIYYDNGNDAAPARWLDLRYEELNFPILEKYYEMYRSQPIFNNSSGFNGTILYTLTFQISSTMTVSSPFSNTCIPFSDVLISINENNH
jgi:hypothetical protein